MIPLSEACRRFHVNARVARNNIRKGYLDAKVVSRPTYHVDPVDFALWAKQLGEYRGRGARILRLHAKGTPVERIAEILGVQPRTILNTLRRNHSVHST